MRRYEYGGDAHTKAVEVEVETQVTGGAIGTGRFSNVLLFMMYLFHLSYAEADSGFD